MLTRLSLTYPVLSNFCKITIINFHFYLQKLHPLKKNYIYIYMYIYIYTN